MPRTYWLETYGCQMNFAESNAIELEFAAAGILPAQEPEEADIVVINTCSVRQTAENRIWGRLGYYQHLKNSRELTLILTGCMAERLADDITRRSPAVDFVVGTNDKQHLLQVIQRIHDNSGEYHFKLSYRSANSAKSLLPIMNGCNNFCAYCIVPYVRGREVSRNPSEILAEVDVLQASGLRELTLLGQNVNSYFWNEGSTTLRFPDLLDLISNRIGDELWIRFLSPHPKDFSDELIRLIAGRRNICSHIHLPVQSGSNAVLSRMRRLYTREMYLELVYSLREADPEITFSTDILAGFPGETDADFELTVSLVKEVGFLDAFTYYFNPREGTEAMHLDGHLPDDVKLSRLQHLISVQRNQVLALKRQRLGRREKVLCEGASKRDPDSRLARTEHDEIVILKGSAFKENEFCHVTISSLTGTTFKGEI